MVLTKTYRIETERLLIRCYEPDDAPLLLEAVLESCEHLKPWMGWAHGVELETLDDKVDQVRRWRGKFDLGMDATYAIFDKTETILLGGTGLHDVHDLKARHIGYWIHADHIRQGYCTEVVRALTRVAIEIEQLERVEIRCAPANTASRAIPHRLGYRHEATLRDRIQDGYGVKCDEMIWSMTRVDYLSSMIPNTPLRAYDVMSRLIV
jgi:RimJ/RimL family protein N-acetyltransferase